MLLHISVYISVYIQCEGFAKLTFYQTELQRSCLPVSVLEEVAGQVQDEDDEAGEVRGMV